MPDTYDAVIAGAGPAGLSAAIVLARHDVRVLVCDPRRLPIDKPCGEGVLPTGLAHLKKLGVLDNLNPAETQAFRGIRVRTVSGLSAAASFVEGPGLGIRRLNLSRALVRTAQCWKNLEVRETAVRGFSPAGRHMQVCLGDGRVQARLVIGADGLNSRVRRWAGLEGGLGRYRRLGVRQHFHVPPWSDHVEVLHGPGIEAYITPCGRQLTGVAFLWDRNRYHARGGQELVPSLLRAFPDLGDRLDGASIASPALAAGPLHRLARRRSDDGVLLIGDAGGYMDACTGEGISLALAQALALERHVVPHLQESPGQVPRRLLAAYERACQEITRPYVQATRLLLFLAGQPAWFDRFIQVMQNNPDLLQHVFSAQMGQASFWPGWSRAWRLLRGILSARPRVLRRQLHECLASPGHGGAPPGSAT